MESVKVATYAETRRRPGSVSLAAVLQGNALRLAGVDTQRGSEVGLCLSGVPHLVMAVAAIAERGRELGKQLKRLCEIRDRFGVIAQLAMDSASVVVGLAIAGIQLDGFIKV